MCRLFNNQRKTAHQPIRSTMTELPRSSENPRRTHGRYGAWKLKSPKKFIRTYGLRRLHTYTSMMVNAWPRKTKPTNTATIWCQKSSILRKSIRKNQHIN